MSYRYSESKGRGSDSKMHRVYLHTGYEFCARVFVGLLLLMSMAHSAFAQTSSEDFRRQPPAPLSSRALKIPQPYETMLPNGLQVIILEDGGLPLTSYRLVLRVGNADSSAAPGMATMLAGMLKRGTESRSGRQIADETGAMGARLTAAANSDYTTVAASSLNIYQDQTLELLADVALHPTFPASELESSKQEAKEGLVAQRAQASFLANERLARSFFGQHPYGVTGPSVESIDSTSHSRLVEFYRAMFVPNNAILIIVGNVTRETVLQRVSNLFGKWNRGQLTERRFPPMPVRTSRTIYLVDRPGAAQSSIAIAYPGISRSSPDYFPLLIMHNLLGGSSSSRLFRNLRADKGYTYAVRTTVDARGESGTFRATADVRTLITGAALKEFFYEFDRIRSEQVSEKEISDAKANLNGTFQLRLETQEDLLEQLTQIRMYGLPADYLQTYRDRVNAVNAADIQRVAKSYLKPDTAAVIVVGDAAAIMDQVKPYASLIELYDTSGNRKAQ